MDVNDFMRIVTSFIDNSSEIISDKNEIIFTLREETIVIKLIEIETDLFVIENGTKYPVKVWITNRLAKLPQLADRILDYIEEEVNFVCPEGFLLNDIERNESETNEKSDNVIEAITNEINVKNALSSQVIYLTSDAGEGKTTLINHLARSKAIEFKEKKSPWLILPIPLGGRPFLRFDDVIIGSLVNRLRFQNFYYDSFLALVRLGIIIPAFDGFEEMFMESSTGEALSALGQLMNKLGSRGTVLIAARRAYFDYKSFTLQARLFDTIESEFVTFSRVSLIRWNKCQFMDYAKKRNISNPDKIYEILSNILGKDHSILTRAILVKQLLDTFKNENEVLELSRKIKAGTSEDYFSRFVFAILEREANTKWIDRSGEPYKPLLSPERHADLLSMISQEMWINNTQFLNIDIIDFIVELFSDDKKLSISDLRQIKERIKQHALLVRDEANRNAYKFDHEEFYNYFLGIFIANEIFKNKKSSIIQTLGVNTLPKICLETVISQLRKLNYSVSNDYLLNLCSSEGLQSYIKENLGAIFIRLVASENDNSRKLEGLVFPTESLVGLSFYNITFENCYFQRTSLENTVLNICNFNNCDFDGIEFVDSYKIINTTFNDCRIVTVYDSDYDNSFYVPNDIEKILQKNKILIKNNTKQPELNDFEVSLDKRLQLTEKIFRRFLKSTQINENIIRMKLGKDYNFFESEVLPVLTTSEVLIEIDYSGSGHQKRYKLGKQMSKIDRALEKAKGDFDSFISVFKN